MYDEQFVVKDEHSGTPVPFTAYRIVTGDGKEYRGMTDEHGQTARISKNKADSIKLFFD